MRLLFALFFLAFMLNAAAGAQVPEFSPGSEHASLELAGIPAGDFSSDAITLQQAAGKTLLTGFHIGLEEGWHTYWRNPGDSGIPARINWTLPEGFSAEALYWPYPQSFQEGRLVTYGYKQESLLYQAVSVAPEVAPGRYELQADVEFLVCREACLPGFETLQLTVELRDGRLLPAEGAQARLFERFADSLPEQIEGRSTYRPEGEQLHLNFSKQLTAALHEAFGEEITLPELDLYFYAASENITEASAAQRFEQQEDELTAVLRISRYRNTPPDSPISGVLVARRGDKTQAYKLTFTL